MISRPTSAKTSSCPARRRGLLLLHPDIPARYRKGTSGGHAEAIRLRCRSGRAAKRPGAGPLFSGVTKKLVLPTRRPPRARSSRTGPNIRAPTRQRASAWRPPAARRVMSSCCPVSRSCGMRRASKLPIRSRATWNRTRAVGTLRTDHEFATGVRTAAAGALYRPVRADRAHGRGRCKSYCGHGDRQPRATAARVGVPGAVRSVMPPSQRAPDDLNGFHCTGITLRGPGG
jgi:hypothetical protein